MNKHNKLLHKTKKWGEQTREEPVFFSDLWKDPDIRPYEGSGTAGTQSLQQLANNPHNKKER